ncbi:MAG: hypothetical protein V9E93_14075 [Steroidobacteraceae bacterium]|nr:hypothetical protein [Steroidobacteraceae bacterium]MBP7014295.1 hypothetical protein [Steroidobacteraceae bacterium]
MMMPSMAQGAEQHAEADHAAADDHDGGIDRIAGQRSLGRAARQHQRHDQCDFDGGDGQRQDQRPVRFADPVGHDLGVMHRRHHRGQQHQRAGKGQDRARGQPQCGDQLNSGGQRHDLMPK